MLLGYNTNGLAHHDPLAAVELLAEIGYRSVALTLDHGLFNPHDQRLEQQIDQMHQSLQRFEFRSVIETGARFLLDPRLKHEPTLMSNDAQQRAIRVKFLQHAIDIAAQLQSDAVSFWSGILRDDLSEEAAFERLVAGLREVIDYAAEKQVTLAFEPEPGMFIDTMSRFEQLTDKIDAPHFQLTLDVGHLYCQGELPVADFIHRWGSRTANVHIEDMRAGVHEHLMFGEGEMDFPPIIKALEKSGYRGALHVELSRHSYVGPTAAQQAHQFLSPLLSQE